jgi:hypothetical protein
MYDGSQIGNIANRAVKIGDDPSDSIESIEFTLSGSWYVCNGNAGTPNLIDRFIRGLEPGTSKFGGDNDIQPHSHPHSHGAGGLWALVGFDEIGGAAADDLVFKKGHGGFHGDRWINDVAGYSADSKWSDFGTDIEGTTAKWGNTSDQANIKFGTGKNMPAYYSVIFIIRMH